ncbi:MAG TPA: hypothetical protein VJ780_09790 [Flavobacterium sp.]|nr:hypothetical protein [Flavobacterium sp.]
MKTIIFLFIFLTNILTIVGQDSFKKYEVKSPLIYKKVQIDYHSNPTARQFKTRIKNDYKIKEMNFAGHYSFIFWGCGSPCQTSVIVDVKTGKVYDGPTAAIGYDYHKDSKLLIVNPKDTTGIYTDCPYCIEEKWLWNEQRKRFDKLDDKN